MLNWQWQICKEWWKDKRIIQSNISQVTITQMRKEIDTKLDLGLIFLLAVFEIEIKWKYPFNYPGYRNRHSVGDFSLYSKCPFVSPPFSRKTNIAHSQKRYNKLQWRTWNTDSVKSNRTNQRKLWTKLPKGKHHVQFLYQSKRHCTTT